MYSFLIKEDAYNSHSVLAVKNSVKEKGFRDEMLQFLEEHVPFTTVKLQNFQALSAILKEFLSETVAIRDFKACRKLFKVCQLLGCNALPIKISCKIILENSTIWNAVSLWTDYSIDLIRKDMNKWAKLNLLLKEHSIEIKKFFGSMSGSEVRVSIVVFRLQALISSMRSVGLRNDKIQFILSEIGEAMSFKECRIDLLRIPSNAFLLRLLDHFITATDNIMQQYKSDDKISTLYYELNTKSISAIEFQPVTHANQHCELGYTPLIELLFQYYFQSLRALAKHYPQTAAASASQQNVKSPNTAHSSSFSCVCGCPINKWKFVGMAYMSTLDSTTAAGAGASHTLSADEIMADAVVTPSLVRPRAAGGFTSAQNVFNSPNGPGKHSKHSKVYLKQLRANVCRMLCERCYRHLLSNPYTVVSDTIYCAGVCPVTLIPPLEVVTFDNIFNRHGLTGDSAEERTGHSLAAATTITGSLDDKNYLDDDDAFQEAGTVPASLEEELQRIQPQLEGNSIDFHKFDSKLSAVLKRKTVERGNESADAKDGPSPGQQKGAAAASKGAKGAQQQQDVTDAAGRKGKPKMSIATSTTADEDDGSVTEHMLVPEDSIAAGDFPGQNTHLLPVASAANIISPKSSMPTVPWPVNSYARLYNGAPIPPPGAVTATTPKGNSLKNSINILQFFSDLWHGITISLMFSGTPVIEKVRILYVRSAVEKHNALIAQQILPLILHQAQNTAAGGVAQTASNNPQLGIILDQLLSFPLCLCWAHRSEKGKLLMNAEKSIAVDGIKHIKIGAGKWLHCINIAGESKALVIKIEDELAFQVMIDGLTGLVSRKKKPTA